MEWTEAGLRSALFEGFVPVVGRQNLAIPDRPGVFIVLHNETTANPFMAANPAGRFRGKDPSVDRQKLTSKWLMNSSAVYIGAASGGGRGDRTLRRRLEELRRFGAGEPTAHWGGRYLWQLTNSHRLLVCWKETSAQQAQVTKSELLDEFQEQFGALPFANLKRGNQIQA